MPVSIQRVIPPDEWKEKQIGNLKAVGAKNYEMRVKSPRRDPIEAGKAAEEKYAEAMRKVIDEKRRLRGLEKTNSDEWLNYTLNIGKERLVDGVVKREAKVAEFVRAWQPLLVDHLSKIDAMPDVTDADREARMIENLRGLKALKGRV